METPESSTPNIVDLGADWESVLTAEAATNPAVSAKGSTRSGAGSVAIHEAPKVTPRDVEPLVRALGAISTRMAQVAPLTDAEIKGVAEPTAALLVLLAPNIPPWAIPASTLAARLGDIVEARSDEFKARRAAETGDPAEPAKAPTLVEAEGF